MIRSMTGYGKAEIELSKSKLTIEIKSLNSKQLDLSVRLPYLYNEKELELRTIVSKELERGKISIFINKESIGANLNSQINKELAKNFYNQLRDLSKELGETSDIDYLSIVMRMPEVVKQNANEDEEDDWHALKSITIEAIKNLDVFRIHEGLILEEDFINRINKIESLLVEIESFEQSRLEKTREKLEQLLKTNIEESKIDKNRFEQELIFYLEKLDVTEEKVRLKKHCQYFMQCLEEDVVSKGKKLGFILQEIGREINTLGSKSNDSSMQKIIVQMKDELEKIKEQSLNIL